MTQLVLPNDTNILGNLLGGQLIWIDIAGALAASGINKVVATVALDNLDLGICTLRMVILKARLTGR